VIEATSEVSVAFNQCGGMKVFRLLLTALMSWALCVSVANCGSANVQSPPVQQAKEKESPAPQLVLTAEKPVGAVPIAASVFDSKAQVLVVEVTKVNNPGGTPVTISVSLASNHKDKTAGKSQAVGNFSLYPADQPGKFLLNAAPALRQLALVNKDAKTNGARLVFEMKKIHEQQAATPIELTIAPPKWRVPEE
jgi:hypothetical protein